MAPSLKESAFLKEDTEHNKIGKRSPNYLWDSLSLAFSDFIAISVLLMGIYWQKLSLPTYKTNKKLRINFQVIMKTDTRFQLWDYFISKRKHTQKKNWVQWKRGEPALIIIHIIMAHLIACLPLDGQYKCQETKIIAAKMVVKGIFLDFFFFFILITWNSVAFADGTIHPIPLRL